MATYRHGLVTFVDLLGFGDKVDGGAPPDEILAMINAVKEHTHLDAATKKILDCELLCVSDCMIRSQHLPHDHKVTAPDLQQELLIIAHMQAELIVRGYPIRGAVTHGAIYFQGRTLFGPAYQAAYRLEKNAKFPRIIVDAKVLADFVGFPEGYGDATWAEADREVYDLLLRDTDGHWFVDYLRGMESEFEDEVDYLNFLLAHRRLVIVGLAKFSAGPVHEKYDWMRTYHNGVCAQRSHRWLAYCGRQRADILVP